MGLPVRTRHKSRGEQVQATFCRNLTSAPFFMLLRILLGDLFITTQLHKNLGTTTSIRFAVL